MDAIRYCQLLSVGLVYRRSGAEQNIASCLLCSSRRCQRKAAQKANSCGLPFMGSGCLESELHWAYCGDPFYFKSIESKCLPMELN